MYNYFKFIVNATIVGLAFYWHEYTVQILGWIALIMTAISWIRNSLPKREKQGFEWDNFDWDIVGSCDSDDCKCRDKNDTESKEL